MAALTDDEVVSLLPIVEGQARKVAVRYEGIDQLDVTQETWAWLLDKGADQARKCLDLGQLGTLRRMLYNAAVRYCEGEKKATLGYDWRDDYTYTRTEVSRLLPLALDPTTIPGLQGGSLHDGPSSRSDPAYGGGLLASVVDVRTAFEKLSGPDQEYVKIVVALDMKWEAVAIHTGVKANSAYAKFMRIVDRMVTKHLGRKTDDE